MEYLEKKVFFLYPHNMIQNEIIIEIIKNEYEAYILNDHIKTIKILKKYPNSILFINIDTNLKEAEWIKYIRSIMESPETKEIKIGILSFIENNALEEKYLMELLVPCGFIKLNLGIEKCKNIILKALEANEAKGRRKHIRIECRNKSLASFNMNIDNKFFSGEIDYISSVGMAIIFDEQDLKLVKNTKLNDIQLRLKGSICTVSGIIFGNRKIEGKIIYVIMFVNTNRISIDKIHLFISGYLQSNLSDELKNLK